jgi:hypothetical protein
VLDSGGGAYLEAAEDRPFRSNPDAYLSLNRSGFVFLGAEMTGFLYIFVQKID